MCETVTISVECAKQAHSALVILQREFLKSSRYWARNGMSDTARLCDEHATEVGGYADEMQKAVEKAQALADEH